VRAFRAYGLALLEGAVTGLRALSYLPERPDRVPEEDLAGLVVRGRLRVAAGRLAGAEADLTSAVARTRPGGPRVLGLSGRIHLGMCHVLDGDWQQAAHQAEIGLTMVESRGRTFDRAALYSLAATVEAARGEPAAEEHVARATEEARALDYAGPYFHIALARAMAARARGDHRGVLGALRGAAGDVVFPERSRLWRNLWLPFHVEALLDAGETEAARRALAPLEAEDDPDDCLLVPVRSWLGGRVAEARGQAERAERAYAAGAAAGPDHQDVPIFRGLAEQAYGAFLTRRGRREEGRRHTVAAEEVFTALGALPFLERCRAGAAAAGVAERPAGAAGGLSPREREVAHLVGLGRTNREIAGALFLSVKTVEYHLRGIFGKLGVRNRRELRDRVQRGL
jgi:DNA-binding CsgD family transcriptional regulator